MVESNHAHCAYPTYLVFCKNHKGQSLRSEKNCLPGCQQHPLLLVKMSSDGVQGRIFTKLTLGLLTFLNHLEPQGCTLSHLKALKYIESKDT